MRRFSVCAVATVAITACSSLTTPAGAPLLPQSAAPQTSREDVAPALAALTPIATSFTYSNGTISIVNASGTARDLSNVEVTFEDADAISSVWGTPWMGWQIEAIGHQHTLIGGTAAQSWPNNGALTIQFTPSWHSTSAVTGVRVYEVAPPPLVACKVKASESAGTISIVNAGTAAIPLRSAVLAFTYPAAVGNVWGTPWMAWTATKSANRYTLRGGTKDATTLARGATLTASFTPVAGAKATKMTFKAACGPQPSPSPTPVASATPQPTATPAPTPTPAPPGALQFVGFWESWSDTNTTDGYNQLGMVPASVTTTDVAFSIANDNTIAPVQNYYPLLPGAQAIHGRGGKVLLSFGGATSQFEISDVTQFVANLKAFQAANPGLYDGFDFDDEVMPWNGRQQLISIIKAVRAAFPKAIVSFDAFMSGGDPVIALNTHQGEDIAILQQAGGDIDYVNVMDYDQYDWHPSTNPSCSFTPGAMNDCRLDVLKDFAAVKMPGGETFPAAKIVMGLMIGSADDGAIIAPADASAYATWIRAHGYGGIMIWDLDRDNPQSGPDGTGHPKGTYVNAISSALNTPAVRRR